MEAFFISIINDKILKNYYSFTHILVVFIIVIFREII
uniref:Uncharacterized protein n=1 Tax=viral metagenome TaxID=1070528 RepID=A0A6C0H992_9ZZZZ